MVQLSITGSFFTGLGGTGGTSEFGNGGYGQGGFGELFAWNGGTAAVGTDAQIFANGTGGDGLASGGEGQGGSAYFSSSSGGHAHPRRFLHAGCRRPGRERL